MPIGRHSTVSRWSSHRGRFFASRPIAPLGIHRTSCVTAARVVRGWSTSNRGIAAGKPRRLVDLVLRAREGHPERLLVHLPTLTAPRNRSAPDDRRAPIVVLRDNGLRRLSAAMRQRFVSMKLSAKQRGASSLWPAVVRKFSGRWSVRSVLDNRCRAYASRVRRSRHTRDPARPLQAARSGDNFLGR